VRDFEPTPMDLRRKYDGEPFFGSCEACGATIEEDDFYTDDYDNKYHPMCNEVECSICKNTFHLHTLVEDQLEDVCCECSTAHNLLEGV
jgi:hypothetical protein